MQGLCGGRIAVSRALHPEPLNGVASRAKVVFYDEKKRFSEGATTRGSGNGYSIAIVAITWRLRACGYGSRLAQLRVVPKLHFQLRF
jgi:hypothetical protein